MACKNPRPHVDLTESNVHFNRIPEICAHTHVWEASDDWLGSSSGEPWGIETVNLAIYLPSKSLGFVGLFATSKHHCRAWAYHKGRIRMLKSSSCFVFKYTTACMLSFLALPPRSHKRLSRKEKCCCPLFHRNIYGCFGLFFPSSSPAPPNLY